MSTTTPSTRVGRRSGRRFCSLGATLALLISSALPALLGVLPAQADTTVPAGDDGFSIRGAGFGHGLGMSQYGAYGAARSGLSWQQILDFYYPGTTPEQQKAGTTIRVWITADNDNSLKVLPAAGLTVRDADGHTFLLPTGSDYRAWRISRSGTGYRLASRDADGIWTTRDPGLDTATWSFADTAKIVRVVLPGGAVRELRGTVALVKRGTGGRTVNRLSMEAYVRAVVPSEMPTSWAADAVRSQAVAARSYAARLKAGARAGTGYDLCDTSSCQVYRGYAGTSGGRRVVHETANGNAAVTATARTVLTYGSTIAFTQFASSNGGHTAKGGYPYLTAHADPFDGLVVPQSWRRTVTVDTVRRAFPSVGTVTGIKVVDRDGEGAWGGRVTSIRIIGTTTSVTVGGGTFRSRLGLRSTLFTVRSAPATS